MGNQHLKQENAAIGFEIPFETLGEDNSTYASTTVSYFKKARVQLDDLAFNKLNFRKDFMLFLCMINRRRIPLPAAVYDFFTAPSEMSDDLGSENFLMSYMLPEQGKCFVDIGANVGCWAFFVAKKGFEVYAYEPGPKAFAQMKSRAKKFPNLHTYPYALGDTDRVGCLGFSAFGKGGNLDQQIDLPGGGTINVAIRKLDSLHLPEVGVIKIDTEGYETPILQGARMTIQRYRPRLVIEVHRQTGKAAQTFDEERKKIEKILELFGYTWTTYCRQISLHGEMQPFLIGNPKN